MSDQTDVKQRIQPTLLLSWRLSDRGKAVAAKKNKK